MSHWPIPDTVLCHLTSPKAKLTATVTVAKGMGYVPAEENATDEIGVIPLDASFSPVIKANYTIEAARVGRSSNFDKVRLALPPTVPSLRKMLSKKLLVSPPVSLTTSTPNEAYIQEVKQKSVIETAGFVDDLDLPTRVLNAMKKADINKLSDLRSSYSS